MLAALLQQAKSVVVFTGAGMSTEASYTNGTYNKTIRRVLSNTELIVPP